jgi:ABC-2 type transport system permease protein
MSATTLDRTAARAPRRTRRGSLARHSAYLAVRSLRALWRQPAFAVATLVQPIIWLLLFGQLFRRVVEIPGFGAPQGSYLEFLTPGVIVMTALFSSGWAGTVYIDDMNRGVMDRFLASPVRRGALMAGTLAYQAATTIVQTVVVLVVAVIAGARFPGGVVGVLVTLAAACLISVIMASLSNALALLLRSQEALIGISQFVVLPLQFLSSALIATALAAAWVADVARFNPVDWAVVASRGALSPGAGGTDWQDVGTHLGLLAALALVMAWLATRAFRTYQRSL